MCHFEKLVAVYVLQISRKGYKRVPIYAVELARIPPVFLTKFFPNLRSVVGSLESFTYHASDQTIIDCQFHCCTPERLGTRLCLPAVVVVDRFGKTIHLLIEDFVYCVWWTFQMSLYLFPFYTEARKASQSFSNFPKEVFICCSLYSACF